MSNTEIRQVEPSNIKVSEFNERKRVFDTASDDSPSLQESVEEVGIVEPPKVRDIQDDEFDYEVIVGQRRVDAATDSLDEIEVIVGDWSDEEALTMSISENIEGFKQNVSTTDRARALQSLWEMNGEEGYPSSTFLSEKIGVPVGTVDKWIEPLRPQYEDTVVEDEVKKSSQDENGENTAGSEESIVNSLGESLLSEVRKSSSSPEEINNIAERVSEEDFTLEEVKELRTYLEDGDDLDTAVEKINDKEEEDESPTSFKDFSNQPDTEDVEDPTDVVSKDDEEEETQESSSFTQQIQSVDTVDVELEGELEAEFELPEKTYDRAESFASDFGFDSVEDFLLVSAIPEYLESEEGTSTLIDTIESKVKARGY